MKYQVVETEEYWTNNEVYQQKQLIKSCHSAYKVYGWTPLRGNCRR